MNGRIVLMVLLLISAVATAQEDTREPATSDVVSAEQVEQLRGQIEDAEDTDDETRKKALETCQQALDAIARAEKLESQTTVHQAEIDGAAQRAKDIEAALEIQVTDILADLSGGATLPELMSALASRQPLLQEARSRLATAEAEPARQTERRTVITTDLAAHANRKAEVEKELAVTAPADEAPAATAARRVLLQARLREVNAQAPAWQAELSGYDAARAVDLPDLKIRLAKREVSYLEQEVDELNRRITAKRSKDAHYIAERLEAFASGEGVASPYGNVGDQLFSGSLTDSAHLQAASDTAVLAAENVDVTTRLTSTTNRLNQAQKKLGQLRSLKSRLNDRIDRVGLTGAIGLELRRHLRTLDDPRRIRVEARRRQKDMQDLEFQRLDLEDRIPEVSGRLETLKDPRRQSDVQGIEMRLDTDLLTTLTTLEENCGELFNRLGELDVTQQEYVRGDCGI